MVQGFGTIIMLTNLPRESYRPRRRQRIAVLSKETDMQPVASYPHISPRFDQHRWFNGFCSDCGCSDAIGFKRMEACVPDPDLKTKAVNIVAKST